MPTDSTLEKPLPNNLDAERSVLRAVILDNNALNADSSIFQLAEDRVRAGLIPIKEIVDSSRERLEKIFREGKSISGISTGYGELDKLTSGFQPSELLILAARPSQGKTALALNLAENIALRPAHPSPIFSLQMSKESLLQRLVPSCAHIDPHTFRTS